jgi:hypothetical protein
MPCLDAKTWQHHQEHSAQNKQSMLVVIGRCKAQPLHTQVLGQRRSALAMASGGDGIQTEVLFHQQDTSRPST